MHTDGDSEIAPQTQAVDVLIRVSVLKRRDSCEESFSAQEALMEGTVNIPDEEMKLECLTVATKIRALNEIDKTVLYPLAFLIVDYLSEINPKCLPLNFDRVSYPYPNWAGYKIHKSHVLKASILGKQEIQHEGQQTLAEASTMTQKEYLAPAPTSFYQGSVDPLWIDETYKNFVVSHVCKYMKYVWEEEESLERRREQYFSSAMQLGGFQTKYRKERTKIKVLGKARRNRKARCRVAQKKIFALEIKLATEDYVL